ncbi:putative Phosphatidylinositol 3,4,5-trisphosphate 3-phosphatase [Blattamonas nauphoetae]|uniref:Phosphatidylinositol 3,4,5-trisphosphate 3-phosphatase n=1 Tax=Blattamonas nauphoetae TaxID=2049346 RepID=A0ABQ9XE28_9EUKA|nr:putative Phosphatidylinositol 3,4,5-trisphosphate 3-phosphatase [Blattamonas nauphoetae]
MFNAIRRQVSGKRIRYQKDGYDLDLTYITPQLIAMGLPSEGFSSVYRNNVDDVARFFESKHQGHYLILNLAEIKYDYRKFQGQVKEFGFPDHHPPQLHQLFEACRFMKEYLDSNQKNVIAVHCKAGKGRTGVVISCYFQYIGQYRTAIEAMDFFAMQRAHDIRGGVAVPSQRRYVHYFNEILYRRIYPIQVPMKIRYFEFSETPNANREGGIYPVLTISCNGKLIYHSLFSSPTTFRLLTAEQRSTRIPCNCVVSGDVLITFFHMTGLSRHQIQQYLNEMQYSTHLPVPPHSDLIKLWRIGFNTTMHQDNTCLDYSAEELDGPKHVVFSEKEGSAAGSEGSSIIIFNQKNDEIIGKPRALKSLCVDNDLYKPTQADKTLKNSGKSSTNKIRQSPPPTGQKNRSSSPFGLFHAQASLFTSDGAPVRSICFKSKTVQNPEDGFEPAEGGANYQNIQSSSPTSSWNNHVISSPELPKMSTPNMSSLLATPPSLDSEHQRSDTPDDFRSSSFGIVPCPPPSQSPLQWIHFPPVDTLPELLIVGTEMGHADIFLMVYPVSSPPKSSFSQLSSPTSSPASTCSDRFVTPSPFHTPHILHLRTIDVCSPSLSLISLFPWSPRIDGILGGSENGTLFRLNTETFRMQTIAQLNTNLNVLVPSEHKFHLPKNDRLPSQSSLSSNRNSLDLDHTSSTSTIESVKRKPRDESTTSRHHSALSFDSTISRPTQSTTPRTAPIPPPISTEGTSPEQLNQMILNGTSGHASPIDSDFQNSPASPDGGATRGRTRVMFTSASSPDTPPFVFSNTITPNLPEVETVQTVSDNVGDVVWRGTDYPSPLHASSTSADEKRAAHEVEHPFNTVVQPHNRRTEAPQSRQDLELDGMTKENRRVSRRLEKGLDKRSENGEVEPQDVLPSVSGQSQPPSIHLSTRTETDVVGGGSSDSDDECSTTDDWFSDDDTTQPAEDEGKSDENPFYPSLLPVPPQDSSPQQSQEGSQSEEEEEDEEETSDSDEINNLVRNLQEASHELKRAKTEKDRRKREKQKKDGMRALFVWELKRVSSRSELRHISQAAQSTGSDKSKETDSLNSAKPENVPKWIPSFTTPAPTVLSNTYVQSNEIGQEENNTEPVFGEWGSLLAGNSDGTISVVNNLKDAKRSSQRFDKPFPKTDLVDVNSKELTEAQSIVAIAVSPSFRVPSGVSKLRMSSIHPPVPPPANSDRVSSDISFVPKETAAQNEEGCVVAVALSNGTILLLDAEFGVIEREQLHTTRVTDLFWLKDKPNQQHNDTSEDSDEESSLFLLSVGEPCEEHDGQMILWALHLPWSTKPSKEETVKAEEGNQEFSPDASLKSHMDATQQHTEVEDVCTASDDVQPSVVQTGCEESEIKPCIDQSECSKNEDNQESNIQLPSEEELNPSNHENKISDKIPDISNTDSSLITPQPSTTSLSHPLPPPSLAPSPPAPAITLVPLCSFPLASTTRGVWDNLLFVGSSDGKVSVYDLAGIGRRMQKIVQNDQRERKLAEQKERETAENEKQAIRKSTRLQLRSPPTLILPPCFRLLFRVKINNNHHLSTNHLGLDLALILHLQPHTPPNRLYQAPLSKPPPTMPQTMHSLLIHIHLFLHYTLIKFQSHHNLQQPLSLLHNLHHLTRQHNQHMDSSL